MLQQRSANSHKSGGQGEVTQECRVRGELCVQLSMMKSYEGFPNGVATGSYSASSGHQARTCEST